MGAGALAALAVTHHALRGEQLVGEQVAQHGHTLLKAWLAADDVFTAVAEAIDQLVARLQQRVQALSLLRGPLYLLLVLQNQKSI